MGYQENILKRATLENITDFLLFGTESISGTNPENEIENLFLEIKESVSAHYEPKEVEELLSLISLYNAATERTMFELGFQCGLKLQHDFKSI